MSVEPHVLRQEIGDFGSIIFVKAILTGIEEQSAKEQLQLR
jgi:hypothetical protein